MGTTFVRAGTTMQTLIGWLQKPKPFSGDEEPGSSAMHETSAVKRPRLASPTSSEASSEVSSGDAHSDVDSESESTADPEEEDAAPTGPMRRSAASVVDGVKFRFGTKPKEWTDEKTGRHMTNVAHVNWHKSNNKWQVTKINDAGKKVFVAICATLAEAVEKRRGVKDGVIGPGELVVRADGTVWVDKCSRCYRPFPLAHFTPTPCLNSLQKLPRFEACASALASEDASECDAAWAEMRVKPETKVGCQALRTAQCFACREIRHKSETEGDSHMAKCYAMAKEIRADMAEKGCDHPGCTERRPECLEGDHVDRAGKRCKADMCTNYVYFARKYGAKGPEEMWKSYRALRVLCKNHHMMQDSHNAARGADSATLTDPNAKQIRKNREECAAYNNKRKIGKACYYCKMVFTKENARMGAWMHPEDGTGKTANVGNLVRIGVSFKTQKPKIDRVIDVECGGRIGCHNCHYVEETFPMFKRQEERFRALVDTVYKWGGDAPPSDAAVEVAPATSALSSGQKSITSFFAKLTHEDEADKHKNNGAGPSTPPCLDPWDGYDSDVDFCYPWLGPSTAPCLDPWDGYDSDVDFSVCYPWLVS